MIYKLEYEFLLTAPYMLKQEQVFPQVSIVTVVPYGIKV